MTRIAEPEADVGADKAGHPRGLYVLFATEMWERFGFYTAAAIMTLYLQRGGFGWTKDQATTLWSNYLMFVYATPLIGGWLADRFLGYRRAVLIGGIVFVVGYFLLSLGSVALFYATLALLFIGNGFFKPNISTMVGNLYPPGSPLRDSAYNIFYMGINIGAFLAPLTAEAILQRFVSPAVYEAAQKGLPLSAADAASLRTGFLSAFFAAAAGMALGTLIFLVFYRKLGVAERRPSPIAVSPVVAGDKQESVAVTEDLPPILHEKTAIDEVPESRRIAALLVIFAIVIVFWMSFHQNGSTMIYWADENTDWKSSRVIPWVVSILSLGTVDSSKASGVISAAINPFWIIVLSLPLVRCWGWLNQKGLEPSTPAKMALGMTLTCVAFLILYVAALSGGDQKYITDAAGKVTVVQGKVSPWWLIAAYGVLSLGELMLSPMGLSLVSKVAPIRMRGLMMGGWFVATAIGNKLTMIGLLWTRWYHSSFWLFVALMALAMALLLFVLIKPLKRAMPGV
ncbi:MAG: peptide MFS transporter [Isosphaeraceae bacterium]|nr:peptide MFS transporter [Isosphaeraceae bacterium]